MAGNEPFDWRPGVRAPRQEPSHESLGRSLEDALDGGPLDRIQVVGGFGVRPVASPGRQRRVELQRCLRRRGAAGAVDTPAAPSVGPSRRTLESVGATMRDPRQGEAHPPVALSAFGTA